VDLSTALKLARRHGKDQKLIPYMHILGPDIVSIELNESQSRGQFQTDTAISNKPQSQKRRELVAWVPEDDGNGADLSFSSNGASWDQFAVNEKKFGVTTDFNEDIYTTKLDKSASDFKTKEARAARLAREIENVLLN
jgi:PAB1-binding protein PBP1